MKSSKATRYVRDKQEKYGAPTVNDIKKCINCNHIFTFNPYFYSKEQLMEMKEHGCKCTLCSA